MSRPTPSLGSPERVCPNCLTSFCGNYCPHCGQDAQIKTPTVRKYLHELMEKYFGIEGRLPLTLKQLFLHPGAMTADYLEGRRQRYISPLRLYLSISVLFFLGLMQVPGISVRIDRAGVEINTEAMADSRVEAHTGLAFIDQRVTAFAQLPLAARDHVLRGGMVRNAPRVMLLLIPVFAGMLMVLYQQRYYGEHLLTALHFHSFAFLLLMLGLIPWPAPVHNGVNNAINLVLAAYLFLMLRRIYGGGKFATALRLVVIIAVYVFAIASATLANVVLALGY
ncbi:MAG: DUF3667 domain-containing protein [Nevskia sp.]|nr:DUF3667 domain-containing protein [Nevskia sp.]MCK9384161.1 DUF3667 domain-containing protein [Nevskia sp.]